MKKNDTKAIISATLCLLVICFVVTFAVSGANAVFEEKIAEQEWLSTQDSMNAVLPADNYEEFEASDGSTAYKALESSGNTIGYIFITESTGYGSAISVMTAISDGEVVTINILNCSDETPGLGQNVTKEDFTSQFSGLTSEPKVTKGEATGENEIQAVTGATKSSAGVARAVAAAFELYEAVTGQKGG